MRRRLAATALLFLVAWGCADLVTGPAPSAGGTARSLRLAPSALALAVGGTGRASATLLDAAGQDVAPASGRTIVFASSAPDVFTVGADGTATGVAAGQGTLTASYGAFSVGIPVTVTGGAGGPPVIDLVPAGPLVDTTVVASASRTTIARTIAVANAGQGTLSGLAASVSYASEQPTGWLQNLRLDAATAPTSMRFDLVRGALAVGAYDATVRVSTPQAGVAPRDLAVRLVVDYNTARIGLSRDTVSATTYTGATATRVAVAVTERSGLGVAALGTLSCADLRLGQGSWATVERCSDSVVVRLDPALVTGVVTGTLRVASFNTRDTASLVLRLDAVRPAIRFVPDSIVASATASGPALRLAADVVESSGRAGEGIFGALQCTIAAPAGAPPATVSACGDSVVVGVTPGAAAGTVRYVVTVQAPNATAPVAPRDLPVVVTVVSAGSPVIALAPPGPIVDSLLRGVDADSTRLRAVDVSNGGTGTLAGLTASVQYLDEGSRWIRDLRIDATTAPTVLRWTTVRDVLPDGLWTAVITVSSSTPGVAPVDLRVQMLKSRAASIGFAQNPVTVLATAASGAPLVRKVAIIKQSGQLNDSTFRPLTCSVTSPTGAPPLAVTACGDTVAVRLDRNGTAGRYDYVVRVSAPSAPGRVVPGDLHVIADLLESASITVVAGDGQSAPTGSTLPQPVQVLVEAGVGNPVANATVVFRVSAGGGSLAGVTDSIAVTTDANGLATAPAWTLGSAPGLNQLTATALSGPSVTVSATGTAAAPAHLGLSPQSITATSWAGGPSVRVAADVQELSGLGEAALGAITCAAPRYTEVTGWATVLACGDSVIVRVDPIFNGTDQTQIVVTAANSPDTVVLRVRLNAFRPNVAVTPTSLTVSALQNGPAVTAASATTVSVPDDSPTPYTGTVGALSCGVQAPAGAPTLTVTRCGPDSVVVRVTPGSTTGTFSYQVFIDAPNAVPRVNSNALPVTVTVAAAPVIQPFHASILDGMCAYSDVEKLYCWGSNSTGRLGDGTKVRKSRPNPVSTASGSFVLVRGGPGHTCAAGGTVEGYYCWGAGSFGQTGLGTFEDVTLPQRVSLASNIYRRLAVGNTNSCAIIDDGTVNKAYCWGANGRGQLGNGSTASFQNAPGAEAAIPQPYINDISVGDTHACALATSGGGYSLYCWGQGWMLGDGTTSGTVSQRTPVQVNFPDDLPSGGLRAGGDATCLLSANSNRLYCWGVNSYGSAGVGSRSIVSTPTPVEIPGLPSVSFRELVVGERHACVLVIGDAYCWGDNQFGQLGRGTIDDGGSTVPVRVQTSIKFRQLTTSLHTTCGIAQADNTVWCWGYGLTGELGNGKEDNSGVPVQVIGPP